MEKELSFQVLDLEDINVCYSEGVLKVITLLDKPTHTLNGYIELLARKAMRDYPLKFDPSENPFINAVANDNVFKAQVGYVSFIFTAANYNGKNTIFVFLWEELEEQEIQDGQTRRKT
jgi:hypothetical protein